MNANENILLTAHNLIEELTITDPFDTYNEIISNRTEEVPKKERIRILLGLVSNRYKLLNSFKIGFQMALLSVNDQTQANIDIANNLINNITNIIRSQIENLKKVINDLQNPEPIKKPKLN
jgi:hypothetical protein